MTYDDHMTEGQYMDTYYDEDEPSIRHTVILMDLRHALMTAKNAKVGSTFACPNCGKRIVKSTYHKTFCSNAKTHGKRNCKDQFHNRIRALEELT